MPRSRDSIVFIDWDGTLSIKKFWEHSPALFEKAQQILFRDNSQLVLEWMIGKKSSEGICHWLTQKTNVEYETFMKGLIESCEEMEILKEAGSTIARLKQKSFVVLATDNMDCFNRFTVPAKGLDEMFDKIINSSFTGRMKNDEGGRTFTEYARSKSIPFSRCYLIDDSRKTCNLFDSLGGTSLRTNGRKHTTECLYLIAAELGLTKDEFEIM